MYIKQDIKPENFMLTAELPKEFQNKQMQQPQPQVTGGRQIPLAPPLVGIGERLKLIDFGLSVFCTGAIAGASGRGLLAVVFQLTY